MDGLAWLRPTAEQVETFVEYLCEAHSWHKHLPLLEGRRFVVFVAPDAGLGRLVAVRREDGLSLETPTEGVEFTDEHPRLHYGWKTTREYRARFGYLDYSCWDTDDGGHARDAGPAVRLPSDLVARCEFVLYPFVSRTFAEAVTWNIHDEALVALRAGTPHPARDEVIELARLTDEQGRAWDRLAEAEQRWAVGRHWENAEPWVGEPSAELRRYLAIDDDLDALTEWLRELEANKIRRALAALVDWLTDEAEPHDTTRPPS